MNKLQVRIGKLLFIFSLVIFITKIIAAIIRNDFSKISTIDNLSYIIYALLFYISFTWNNEISKYIQVSIISLESILCLMPDMSSSFFGLSMMIISIILIYMYGGFDKYRSIKLFSSIITIYLILVLVPLRNNIEKYLYALQWTLFVVSFLFILWFILKDNLEKIKKEEDIEKDKLINLLEQTRDIARDALIAYEKYINLKKE